MKENKYTQKRLTMARQMYHLFPSRDIDNQRILESDCLQGKQTNSAFFPCKKHYDHLILFPDIDFQRILEPDWVKDTTGHTQPKEVILHATFPWWLPQCKKSKRSTDSF